MANYFGIEKSDLVERKTDKINSKNDPIDLSDLPILTMMPFGIN